MHEPRLFHMLRFYSFLTLFMSRSKDLYLPNQIFKRYFVGVASRKAHIADHWLSSMVCFDLEVYNSRLTRGVHVLRPAILLQTYQRLRDQRDRNSTLLFTANKVMMPMAFYKSCKTKLSDMVRFSSHACKAD